MEFERVLKEIGGFGLFSKTVIAAAGVLVTWHTVVSFLGHVLVLVAPPSQWCFAEELAIASEGLDMSALPRGRCQFIDNASNVTEGRYSNITARLDSGAPCNTGWRYDSDEFFTSVTMESWRILLLSGAVVDLLLAGLVWFVIGLCYNAITLHLGRLGLNIYMTYSVAIGFEMPVNILCMPLMENPNFRTKLYCFGILSGIRHPESETWILVLAVASLMAVAGAYNVTCQQTPELFPTVIRGRAVLLQKLLGEAGSLLGTQVASLVERDTYTPMLVMGALSVLATVAAFFLPETLEQALPQTIEDGENFGKNQGLCFCPMSAARRARSEREQEKRKALSTQKAPKDDGIAPASQHGLPPVRPKGPAATLIKCSIGSSCPAPSGRRGCHPSCKERRSADDNDDDEPRDYAATGCLRTKCSPERISDPNGLPPHQAPPCNDVSEMDNREDAEDAEGHMEDSDEPTTGEDDDDGWQRVHLPKKRPTRTDRLSRTRYTLQLRPLNKVRISKIPRQAIATVIGRTTRPIVLTLHLMMKIMLLASRKLTTSPSGLTAMCYYCFFTGNRPRVCDETAERILERIAARESSDLDLSDSDEEAPEDVAVLDDLEKDLEPDVDSSDEEPVHTVPAAPKRAALWKTTDSSSQTWVPDFNVISDSGEARALWRPFEYFPEYISDEVWETVSTAMNTAHVVETGKSFCTTPDNVVSWAAQLILFGLAKAADILFRPPAENERKDRPLWPVAPTPAEFKNRPTALPAKLCPSSRIQPQPVLSSFPHHHNESPLDKEVV
ncbi:hypothetical protein HPB48_014723 [Haemaphysalis longicornis]|uniref:Uncharacterized protein n=1 Tax=Haemaphysalis longicornis TaxID=44386 RepID=A0A9J6G681_HAELO|nr:hypothetical protein HPB48_014723 [Haemaphysalis longicornis]